MNYILLRRRNPKIISLKITEADLAHIEDIEYFKKKFIESMKVPAKYFNNYESKKIF